MCKSEGQRPQALRSQDIYDAIIADIYRNARVTMIRPGEPDNTGETDARYVIIYHHRSFVEHPQPCMACAVPMSWRSPATSCFFRTHGLVVCLR